MRERLTLAFVGLALVIIVVAGAVRSMTLGDIVHAAETEDLQQQALAVGRVVEGLEQSGQDGRRRLPGRPGGHRTSAWSWSGPARPTWSWRLPTSTHAAEDVRAASTAGDATVTLVQDETVADEVLDQARGPLVALMAGPGRPGRGHRPRHGLRPVAPLPRAGRVGRRAGSRTLRHRAAPLAHPRGRVDLRLAARQLAAAPEVPAPRPRLLPPRLARPAHPAHRHAARARGAHAAPGPRRRRAAYDGALPRPTSSASTARSPSCSSSPAAARWSRAPR